MNKRLRIIILVVLGVITLSAALLLPHYMAIETKTFSGEPSYQGKSLTSWLEDFDTYGTDTNSPPAKAVNAMGTNALPYLLAILSYKEPSLHKQLRRLMEKANINTSFLERNIMQGVYAGYAINVLGEKAMPAFSTLTNLMYGGKKSVCTSIALAGLGREGITVLLSATTNQHISIQHSAIGALGSTRTETDIVVSTLVDLMRTKKNSLMLMAAMGALGELHQKPEIVVPVLVENLKDNNSLVRGNAAIALMQFGPSGKAAIFALENMKKEDSDEGNRQLAENALQEIKRPGR